MLSTCMLERAELAGLLKPGSLRVLDEKTTKGFSCKHTTALYPDIVVASLPKTSPAVVKSTTLALLSMPEDSDFAWQVAHQLRLRQPPLQGAASRPLEAS